VALPKGGEKGVTESSGSEGLYMEHRHTPQLRIRTPSRCEGVVSSCLIGGKIGLSPTRKMLENVSRQSGYCGGPLRGSAE